MIRRRRRSRRLLLGLGCAAAFLLVLPARVLSQPPPIRQPTAEGPRMTVIPPGPVTDRGMVELRLAVPNRSGDSSNVRVRLFQDRPDAAHQLIDKVVTLPPGGYGLVQTWWKTAGQTGSHRFLYRVDAPWGAAEGGWPLTVVASTTPALPMFQGGWIEPLALAGGVYGREQDMTEQELREVIDAVHRLGMNTLIITYVEYMGYFYYPSKLRFYDRDLKREVSKQRFDFDVVGTILSQAERNGMHVFVGLSRAGDLNLLWEFDQPGWDQRLRYNLDVGRRMAHELWQRYGRYRSFYGWYLTHEMNDLARASAYYDLMADICHGFSPDKPVMVAPAGTPKIDRATLEKSRIDIFCYQDAVGAGYVPYEYTYDPGKRLAQLDLVYSWYEKLHAGSGKHLWADLEVWERAGPGESNPTYAPALARVREQLAIEARHTEMVTAYAINGLLEPPGLQSRLKDNRARRLFRDYAEYVGGTLPDLVPRDGR
jgi:hypothetical protein